MSVKKKKEKMKEHFRVEQTKRRKPNKRKSFFFIKNCFFMISNKYALKKKENTNLYIRARPIIFFISFNKSFLDITQRVLQMPIFDKNTYEHTTQMQYPLLFLPFIN